MQDAAGGGVRAVQNALALLETLATAQPVGVSELARLVQQPKSSVQRTLRTLELAGWAETSGEGVVHWRLTRKVFRIGVSGATSSPFPRSAETPMTALRDRYGETVHLGIPDGDHLLVIARIDGTNNLRTFLQLGTRAPLVSTAGGRAMLAGMKGEVLEKVLADPVTGHTPRTLRDPQQIRQQVGLARERGYATNEAEWRDAIAAVGAAIVGPDGQVIGSISLSMPAPRFHELDIPSVGADVAAVCREIAEAVHRHL
jgi:IclR family acetate operon transcriptional repressor